MRHLRLLPLLLPLAGFAFQAAPVTVYLAGDSTLAEKLVDRRPETGWGERLQQYFDADRVRVENHARNGRSTRTFIEEGRWGAIVGRLKPGDYVFVQFGHNDASREKTDRYTPPDAYRANLARFVREAREKGASPVLLTPVMRRRFDSAGVFRDAHGEYPDLVRAVAAEQRVPLIDMHRRSERVLREYGAERSKRLFLHLAAGEHPNYPQGLRDDTHFSPEGAEAMAALAAEGIRELGLGIATHLRPAQTAAPATAYLAPARLAALPAERREAWERYLAASRRQSAVDRDSMAAELRAAGRERWVPAPSGPNFSLTPEMTDGWFRGEEARRMAENVLSYQTPSGGWSKHVDHRAPPRRPGQGYSETEGWLWVGTFDNGATTTHMRFLARADRARPDARYRRAFLRGLDYVLLAQYPGGCWPQVYPLAGSYHDAATYNDDAMVRILRLLQEAGRGEPRWVPADARRRARAATERGIDCILASQVEVDGRRTAWGQQHDPLTLAPVGARSYEHASLSGSEGAGVFDFLMGLDAPGPRVAAAVRGAAAWLRDTAMWGYDFRGWSKLEPRPGAGPLWARFYEIGTNRPIFSNRDGVVRYDRAELTDRAEGYAWFTAEPGAYLQRYEEWSRRHAAPLPRPARARAAAVVDAAHAGPEGARVRGVRTYRTLAAAVADAPLDGTRPYVVSVRDGRYYEKLNVEKPNVHLVGQSREGTVLTYDAAAGKRSPGGWTYGTRGSWTLRVAAPGFRLESMTVENGFDFVGNAAKADTDPTRLQGSQAVAVMLDEGSDRAVFRDCVLAGHQDTLFPNAGRSHFRRCTVLGSVDFIFGAGVAVFEDSDIVSRDRGSRTSNGYVTAPSTPVSRPYGFLFVRSRLRKETPAMAPGSVTLGRPWRPSGNPHAVGSAVFIDCWMDDHVGAKGWDSMNSRDAAGRQVTNRPEDARFREHGTVGPGAVSSPSRRLLTDAELREYAVDRVLEGWDPGR